MRYGNGQSAGLPARYAWNFHLGTSHPLASPVHPLASPVHGALGAVRGCAGLPLDMPPYRSDAEARWRVETEEGVMRRRALMWRAVGGPTGDAQLGELDSYLAAERDHWRGRAERLRAELGPAFLKGTPEKRASMVRDWVRNFQEQGRVPRGRIPPYRGSY